MTSLIRTELLKQRTLRTFIAGSAAAPIVAGLVTVAVLGAAGRQGNEPLSSASLMQVIGAPASIVTAIALLLGVLGMAGEYRHQTITTTFLARPRRREVVLGKMAAHSITGALIGVLSLATTLAIAVPWLRMRGIDLPVDAATVRVAVGAVASTALYGALGVSIGALLRNQTVACGTVLVWLLAVEGIVGDIFHGSAFLHWLPVAAAQAMVRAGSTGGLSVPMATGVFAGYVAVLGIAATRTMVRRDVT